MSTAVHSMHSIPHSIMHSIIHLLPLYQLLVPSLRFLSVEKGPLGGGVRIAVGGGGGRVRSVRSVRVSGVSVWQVDVRLKGA
jgi:hypothetical protein